MFELNILISIASEELLDIFLLLYLFPHEHGFLSFFYAYFKHISAYFSGTKPDFDDTSPHFMILWWYFSLHFLEKSHSFNVLIINVITSYLGRIMILWDFFREKTFLRAHIWCCHLSPCWQGSSGFILSLVVAPKSWICACLSLLWILLELFPLWYSPLVYLYK